MEADESYRVNFSKIIKSRYSGLDWHPPVTEAATARPFTSNNITSPVGPANHNFSTRRYKAKHSAFFYFRVFKICFIFYIFQRTLGLCPRPDRRQCCGLNDGVQDRPSLCDTMIRWIDID